MWNVTVEGLAAQPQKMSWVSFSSACSLGTYLEEEAEADPLVVLDVSPFFRVDGLVHPRVCHINSYPLPEGTGNGVGGVDPTVSVEHILGDLLCVNAVDGISHILPGGDNE